MVTTIKWPPEIDALKVERENILGRVKNTDIWIDLGAIDAEELISFLPDCLKSIFIAWQKRELLP